MTILFEKLLCFTSYVWCSHIFSWCDNDRDFFVSNHVMANWISRHKFLEYFMKPFYKKYLVSWFYWMCFNTNYTLWIIYCIKNLPLTFSHIRINYVSIGYSVLMLMLQILLQIFGLHMRCNQFMNSK